MRRLTAVALASVLVTAGVLRSHLLPLCLLALMGALVGFLVATQTRESRDLLRVPVMVAVTVLVLVGVGQLGVLGILLGLALLVAAMPTATARSRASALRHRIRRTPQQHDGHGHRRRQHGGRPAHRLLAGKGEPDRRGDDDRGGRDTECVRRGVAAPQPERGGDDTEEEAGHRAAGGRRRRSHGSQPAAEQPRASRGRPPAGPRQDDAHRAEPNGGAEANVTRPDIALPRSARAPTTTGRNLEAPWGVR
jgi:hypothetical protein